MSNKTKSLGVCIFCDEPVYPEQKFIVALDRPIRINLITHKKCYSAYREYLNKFLSENLMDYLDKYEDYNDKEKKCKKRFSNQKQNY
jgi:hypothetical protein